MTMSKILIIDDEKPTLDMCSLLLGFYGFEVLTAKTEAEGIRIFKNEHPAIILTDIKMPGKDGFSVLEQIKQIDSKAQVIVMTGHGDKDLATRASDLGATDFINKPISTEALDSALKRAEDNLKSI